MQEPTQTARIVVRDNASNRVYGPALIVDMEDNVILELGPGEFKALCRCGHSREKPFCDGTHKEVGFTAVHRAADFQAPDPSSAIEGD